MPDRTVWVMLSHEDYHGSDLEGVYSTAESAMNDSERDWRWSESAGEYMAPGDWSTSTWTITEEDVRG